MTKQSSSKHFVDVGDISKYFYQSKYQLFSDVHTYVDVHTFPVSLCLCANFSVILAQLSHLFVPLPRPQQCCCVRYLQPVCFLPALFGLALMPLCMCRLITRPGDQWAHPGIVLLSVFDGVSLQALGWIALCSFRNNLERGGVSGKSQ